MLLVWGLRLAMAAPTPASRPEGILDAEIRYEDWPEATRVVLTLVESWDNRAFVEAAELRDPISTMLRPRTLKARGSESWWLQGWRLSRHEEAGDTVVTYSLLLQAQDGAWSGYWYEDRMQVPTTMWTVTGRQEGTRLSLSLTELTEPGLPSTGATVEGSLRLP